LTNSAVGDKGLKKKTTTSTTKR